MGAIALGIGSCQLPQPQLPKLSLAVAIADDGRALAAAHPNGPALDRAT